MDLTLTRDSHTNIVNSATYRKVTASNVILRANSCHPSHMIKAIPVCELTRAKRNCSTTDSFAQEAKNKKNRLKARGYPNLMLQHAEVRESNMSRDKLLKLKFPKQTNKQTGSLNKQKRGTKTIMKIPVP